jgi:predicted RNA-binding protein with PIN domain
MPSHSVRQAVLLVDGYNIIGAWPSLQRLRDQHSLEEARRELVERLVNYSAFQGYQTRVIFDAQYQALSEQQERVTASLSVYYTDFGQTADTYIEKFCAVSRRNVQIAPNRLIVATSDRTQQLMILGYGAEWLSAHQLHQAVEAAMQRVQTRHPGKTSSSQRFLMNSLDPIAQAHLSRLRRGSQPD